VGPRVLLFCHGNAGNIAGRIRSLRLFHDLGLSVLIFDYRGYGRSEGRPSEAGTYADVRAAWRFLLEEEGLRPGEIVVLGRSLGGAVAIDLALLHPPAALIVESTFTSTIDLGSRLYPWLPVRWLGRIRYDSARKIGRVTVPKLFVHSREDDVVPFVFGRRLYDMAPEPKEFLEIHGSHAEAHFVSGERYREGLLRFLRSVGSPDPTSPFPRTRR
jgi:fermentation-respiration switch protein FrsA (DUF1100 family)